MLWYNNLQTPLVIRSVGVGGRPGVTSRSMSADCSDVSREIDRLAAFDMYIVCCYEINFVLLLSWQPTELVSSNVYSKLFRDAQDTQKYVCSIAGYSTIQSTNTQKRASVAQLPSVKGSDTKQQRPGKKERRPQKKMLPGNQVRVPTFISYYPVDCRCLTLLEKSKDPGIPNNFPYKDQILAEIAEERRQVRPSVATLETSKNTLC